MAGSNITFRKTPALRYRILELMGFRSGGIHTMDKLCEKNGAPVSSTAADAPNAKGDICLDYANDDVYVCTSFTSSSTFTWTKIT